MASPDIVYTLADLKAWTETGTWLAVLGHPIKHSVSPVMHNAALAFHRTVRTELATWQYLKFDIDPEQLPEALPLFLERGFIGLNLTVPHKVIAVDCIAEIDEAARPAGAVNTLVRSAKGWKGHNTDGHGMSAGIRADLLKTLPGAHVVLLGAGGAARGAAVQCLQEGVASLTIANRSSPNLETLIADLTPVRRGFTRLNGCLFPDLYKGVSPEGSLLINATSSGLRPDEAAPIELSRLPRPAAVYDMVYSPPQTTLLRDASALSIPNANGLSMLVHQGARALSLWTGLPEEALSPHLDQAARQAMGRT